MKIVDNNEIHTKSGKSIQHKIEEKNELSKQIDTDELAKARTIQKRRLPTNAPKKAVKRDLSRLHFNRNNPFKHKKFRVSLKKSKSKSAKIPTGKSFGVSVPKGGGTPVNIAKSAVTKPVSAVGNKLLSQRADFSKTEDTGTEAVKLGLQTADYARRGVRTIKSAVQAPRKIYKGVKRTVNTGRRVVKTSAKAVRNTAKAARNTAKTARTTARITARVTRISIKIIAKVVKAAIQAVKKIVSLIVETSPWSLIVIAVIIVILLLMYLVNMIIGSAGSSVGAVGGWAVESDTDSDKDIYDNISGYIAKVKSALQSDVQDELKSAADNFANDNIIEFKSDDKTFVCYPAQDKLNVIDGYIDSFGNQLDSEFYADFLAVLYVLKAREMQEIQNSGDSEVTISDLKITDSDISELIKTVNTNTCNFGQTYFYKTTEYTTGKCPEENCQIEYRDDGCQTDSEGNSECGGHPYCPGEHDKLIVNLYSVEKYTGKSSGEIYGFSDEDKAMFAAVKAFIKAITDEFEGGE